VDKRRLELFSDGVFVIVLTLLVLELRPPLHGGLAGLGEIAPGLAVHSLTFFVIGTQWLIHHNMLAGVEEVRTRTLALNLLALFFVTLIPFGARIAAEDPLGSLGIGLVIACRAFYGLAISAMALTAQWIGFDDPEVRPALIRVRWIGLGVTLVYLVAAGLCAVSPWFGYAVVPVAVVWFLLPPVARSHGRIGGRQTGESSTETAAGHMRSEPGSGSTI
jgi:uncharacterized membrane protein